MKKVISLILAIAMAGSLFVSAKNIENHNELTSNRYSYRYKFSSREKDGEYKIVEPTKSREAAETAAEVAISSCTFSTKFPAGVVAIVVFHLGSAIYDMSEPGDVKIYKQVKEKIKVDNLTGQERVVDTWWIIDLELYKADGSLYNSRQHTLKLK